MTKWHWRNWTRTTSPNRNRTKITAMRTILVEEGEEAAAVEAEELAVSEEALKGNDRHAVAPVTRRDRAAATTLAIVPLLSAGEAEG